jgi:hypothetical protein
VIRMLRSVACLLLAIAVLGGVACHLKRPNTVTYRMIEPKLLEPQLPDATGHVAKAPGAAAVRLLETQALGHIGRRLMHQQSDGELTEDSVWRWSSAPDRYLDTALHLEAVANPEVRIVDTSLAPALAATVLEWDLESEKGSRLVGAVEFQVTGTDRALQTQVVRDSEPVSAELPGDLAAAAGRLLHRLASQGLSLAINKQNQTR